MIFLDTNFLIASLVRGSDEDARLRQWFAAGETVTIGVIVWAEFLCGPVSDEDALTPVIEPRAHAPGRKIGMTYAAMQLE